MKIDFEKEKDWKAAAQLYDQLASKGTSKYQEKALRMAGKLYFFELKDYASALKQFNQLSRLTTKSDALIESLRGEVRSYYHLKQWMQGRDASNALISNAAANQDDQSFAEIVLGYAAVLFVWLNYAVHAKYWVPYQNTLFQ